MPTYEYQCDACNHAFEEFQSIKAEALKKCPECGKKKLRRLIGGGAAILFKGSGFYQTDYRSESYKQSAQKEQSTTSSANGDGKSGGDKSSSNGKAEAPASQSSGDKQDKSANTSKSKS